MFSFTLDLGNVTLVWELKLSSEIVVNPIDPTQNIYAAPDAPPLLKLLRNLLIEKGLQLPDCKGGFLPMAREDFVDLLQGCRRSQDSSHADKRAYHVSGSGHSRVHVAPQLLARTSTQAMTYLHGEKKVVQANARPNRQLVGLHE